MSEWWTGLTSLNRFFYSAAGFCSVFFLWQALAALVGLDTDQADADADVGDVDLGDADAGDVELEAGDADAEAEFESDDVASAAAFKLLSIRSIVTFFTLFTWGSALYLDRQETVGAAMGYSVLWGMAGMIAIALIFHGMRKLTEDGTADLRTCIGTTGTVYADIPEGDCGRVRVTVSGVVTYVRARAFGGKALKSMTPIRVIRRLDQTTVEVDADV